ncbi:MAG: cytochrome C oxidase subunit I [Candidatus Pseudobacter hemicellulosilyticus]|uniref:Cytochrome C oxidase subunit I n=1 Tax=Candidatus Pseudobacter hemicellulosilyticus TaxID=3121375 RepID=A0AAJ6BFP6_9BACT|nr:MAG: cytochrome C oxidase subunit I [Pseudobacter sp.]
MVKTTPWKLVIPFYLYAALSFLLATVLIAFSTPAFSQHYFHPHTLAITHIMALGWGTMMVLGASHQLVPVLTARKLYSNKLAAASFILAAAGIPLLVRAFYFFELRWPACFGALLIILSVVCYIINLACTIDWKKENIQALSIFTAACWLLMTTLSGLFLLANLRHHILPKDSLEYLPFHVHTGVVGWFLLLVLGVGSKLIPMFLVSKYERTSLLWWIYWLVNGGLLVFLFLFFHVPHSEYLFLPLASVLVALALFGYYCYNCYRRRIRRKVDRPVSISLLSVAMTALPVIALLTIIGWSFSNDMHNKMVLTYGFTIFFGWLTAIILGMTFKTLPFIIWNKVYQGPLLNKNAPDPKALFSQRLFAGMALAYLAGFFLFAAGILAGSGWLMQCGALCLVVAAVLYNLNVFKVVTHKPARL